MADSRHIVTQQCLTDGHTVGAMTHTILLTRLPGGKNVDF